MSWIGLKRGLVDGSWPDALLVSGSWAVVRARWKGSVLLRLRITLTARLSLPSALLLVHRKKSLVPRVVRFI